MRLAVLAFFLTGCFTTRDPYAGRSKELVLGATTMQVPKATAARIDELLAREPRDAREACQFWRTLAPRDVDLAVYASARGNSFCAPLDEDERRWSQQGAALCREAEVAEDCVRVEDYLAHTKVGSHTAEAKAALAAGKPRIAANEARRATQRVKAEEEARTSEAATKLRIEEVAAEWQQGASLTLDVSALVTALDKQPERAWVRVKAACAVGARRLVDEAGFFEASKLAKGESTRSTRRLFSEGGLSGEYPACSVRFWHESLGSSEQLLRSYCVHPRLGVTDGACEVQAAAEP